jgi:hypothetical protein
LVLPQWRQKILTPIKLHCKKLIFVSLLALSDIFGMEFKLFFLAQKRLKTDFVTIFSTLNLTATEIHGVFT